MEFPLRFRSSHILGFIFAAIIVTTIASVWALWTVRTLQWQSAKDQEIEMVMRAVEGGALKFATLNSTGLAGEFLASHFAALSPNDAPRFFSAHITGGKGGHQTYAHWKSPVQPHSEECASRITKKVLPPQALFPFFITLVANDCWENPALNAVTRAALLAPLIVSIGLLGGLGTALFAMIASVRKADEILGTTSEITRVIALSDGVAWTEVRAMVKRALETKGANLFYFQAIIEEAEHDVLREIGQAQGISEGKKRIIAGIIRKLVLDSQMASKGSSDQDLSFGIEKILTINHIRNLCTEQGLRVRSDSQSDKATFEVADADALSRIIVNLGSNARKHGRGAPECFLALEDNELKICVSNKSGIFNAIGLHFANITGRLDTKNSGLPLVRKWLAREGIGTRILKKSTIALAGTMRVKISGLTFTAEITLPTLQKTGLTEKYSRKKYAAFQDATLAFAAREAGLGEHLVEPATLLQMVVMGSVDEIMVDFPVPSAAENIVIRNVTNATRVLGIVKMWQGEFS